MNSEGLRLDNCQFKLSQITTSAARLYLGPMTSPPDLPVTGARRSPGISGSFCAHFASRLALCREILSSLQSISDLPPSISVVVSMREFNLISVSGFGAIASRNLESEFFEDLLLRHISLIDVKS